MPRFIAQVHHTGVVGKLALRLATYAAGRDEVFPRTIDTTRDSIDEVVYELVEIPDGDTIRLTLTASVGDLGDQVVVEVPIRPWGVQAYASAAGTETESTTVFVGLAPNRNYKNTEMLMVLSSSLERMLNI